MNKEKLEAFKYFAERIDDVAALRLLIKDLTSYIEAKLLFEKPYAKEETK